MSDEVPIRKLTTKESPRQIFREDYKVDLPISGGWGYTKEDAFVIDKNDPTVDPKALFDWSGLEYFIVAKRTYEELIIFRPEGLKFHDIDWKLQCQYLKHDEGRYFDQLIFDVTAISEKTGKPISIVAEFWFDITSFHGTSESTDTQSEK